MVRCNEDIWQRRCLLLFIRKLIPYNSSLSLVFSISITLIEYNLELMRVRAATHKNSEQTQTHLTLDSLQHFGKSFKTSNVCKFP